ncbi:hypothetical protein [Salmonella phage SSBI34]|nr:hypothetical protein [Salmonella phage SSBI34]
MQNILGLTDFIRALKGRSLGFSAVYMVPEGKTYSQAVNGLIATAARENVKISTGQILAVDPATFATIAAIKVTVK